MIKLKGDASKLLKGISFSWIRFGLSIGLGLIQTPILFNNLPSEQLNSWYIFYSFGAFLQMADLGLTQTISRLIAYVDNSEQLEDNTIGILSTFKIKQIYYTSIFSFLCLILLVGIIITVIYFNIQSQSAANNQLLTAFFIYIGSMLFTLLSNIPGAMLIGYRDIAPESIIRSIFQIIAFIILLIGLPHYKSIIFVSITFLLQSVGMFLSLHIAFYIRHKKVFSELLLFKDYIKLKISKNIYKQSLPLAINQLGGWLINQGNIFIASITIGSQNISDYAINQQVFTYIASVALVLNQAIGPFIAKQYIQDKHEKLQQFFKSTTIFCLTIVSVMIVIQAVCGEEVISLWVGHKHYLGLAFSCIFAVITFLEVQHSVSGNFVWNTRSWPFNTWTLAAGILNVGLGYVISSSYGLLGMAIATLVSKLVTLNWYVVYFCLKRLKMHVNKYLINTLIPIAGTAIGTFFLADGLRKTDFMNHINDFSKLIIISIFCFAVIIITTAFLFKRQIMKTYKLINLK